MHLQARALAPVDIALHLRLASQQDGLASFSFAIFARFMTSHTLSGFSQIARRIFSRSFSKTTVISALNH